MALIYLDHAAMTPPILPAMKAYVSTPFGNPSSEHAMGQAARKALEDARLMMANNLDCEPDEITFTSTATEAAALGLKSLAQGKAEGYIGDFYTHKTPKEPNLYYGYEVSCSTYEHHAVSENANKSSIALLYHKAYAGMLANNETGEMFPPPKMTDTDRWFCDATAAVGHIPVSFKKLGCDYLICDGIKFGGVSGAACLVTKRGAPLYPMIHGGGQEHGNRSGTENVPAICAMASALEWHRVFMKENTEKLSKLSEIFQTILSEIPSHKWNMSFGEKHLPHIMNISFKGVDAHALTLMLSEQDIMVSAGAACSNGKNEPSHVIMAKYGDEDRARSAIRISLSHQNTMDECIFAAKKIKKAVAYLRSLAP